MATRAMLSHRARPDEHQEEHLESLQEECNQALQPLHLRPPRGTPEWVRLVPRSKSPSGSVTSSDLLDHGSGVDCTPQGGVLGSMSSKSTEGGLPLPSPPLAPDFIATSSSMRSSLSCRWMFWFTKLSTKERMCFHCRSEGPPEGASAGSFSASAETPCSLNHLGRTPTTGLPGGGPSSP